MLMTLRMLQLLLPLPHLLLLLMMMMMTVMMTTMMMMVMMFRIMQKILTMTCCS